jgi:hypothetical protein
MVVAFAAEGVKKRACAGDDVNRTWVLLATILWIELSLGAIAAPFHATPAQRARVVIVEEPGAVATFSPQWEFIQPMVERGLLALTGDTDVGRAWKSLVRPEDVVGFKVYSAPGPTGGTRPAVVAALVQSLIAAGHSPHRIVIWDRNLSDLRL